MKKSVLFLMMIFLWGISYAQLTGTKTIPGDYATVAAAITALNTAGVGAGGVTFNITAGYAETFPSLTAGLITATGTSANPIVFQKSGAGANPLITAATPGSGTYDYIFCIGGADYVTFDGINIQENPANTTATQQMEFGFAVFKASATDGAQNNTIKNGTISLSANTACYGIYSNNRAYTAPGTTLTITSADGTNSGNKFFSLTFNTCYNGIYLYGFADGTAPYTYYDQNNQVGKDGANTFNSHGGGSAAAYGIYGYYQNDLYIANNSFLGTVGTSASAGALYCIYLSTMNNANLDIYSNTVTITYNGTGAFYGMYSTAGASGTSNTTNIYNNSVTNCSLPNATSGTFYGMYMYGGMTSNFYNNIVTNNAYGAGTSAATGTNYWMYNYCSPTSSGTMNVYGNTVANNSRVQSTNGGGTGYHFYLTGGNGTMNAYNNLVNNQTIGSTGTQYIGYILYSGIKNFYNNTITNILNSNGGTLYSIYNGNGSGNALFYNNKIQNVNGNATGSVVYGFYQSSGANVYLYNNYISELKAPIATGNPAIYGIYFSGGTTLGAYNNTIYLNATSTGASFGVAGIYASSTPNVDLRNNIVVNASTPGATGRVVAYQRSTSTLTTYAGTANNNDFWAGTPGANRLIYYDGTNADQTMADYKARVSPRDGASISENPPFVNVATSPYDLHIQTTLATQCEAAGSVVATPVDITTDFDNNPRYPNTGYPFNPAYPPLAPDMGADEFGGIPLDITPPNVALTPLMNTSVFTPRTLVTTITDQTGVPTTGTGLPVLYWQIGAGAWSNVTGVSLGSNQYSFTFGAGVTLGDVVSYYIVAQDLVTPVPNVGATPPGGAAGFTLNPPACSTPPTTPFSYTIVAAMCGNYEVGVGKTYATLTAAVGDLNAKEITCPVTLLLTDAAYPSETFPIVLGNVAGSSAVNTITIKPATGITPTFSGSSTSGIFVAYGASNLIIDGSNSGGTDKSLTWENTSTAANTYTIGFFNDGTTGASNDILKNCNIKASSQVSNNTYAIILNALGGNYNGIVIHNNTISSARYGIQFAGVSGSPATNGQITDNIIGSATDAAAIQYRGIVLSQADNTLIRGNEIMGAPLGNTNTYQTGIYIIAGSTNSVIKSNNIHDWYYTGTSGYGCYGIYYAAEATSPTEISNNVIHKIKSDGDPGSQNYAPAGIYIYAGGNLSILHNSIYMSGATLSSSYVSYSACISVYSGISGLDVRNNILKNSMQPVSGTANSTYAIYSASANTAYTNINFNDYFVDGINPKIGYLGAVQSTLADWKTATGQDVNSINTDPLFTSATNLIPTNLTMNKAGFYLSGVPDDFTGILRTNPPDMGAYEYGVTPLVVTTAASAVGFADATLNGSINASGLVVNSFFDYGTTTSYGTTVPGIPASVTGNTTTPINQALTGLAPITTYHYRARGVTAGGLIVYGEDKTFTTTAPPPTVVTTAATGITAAGATLNGTVNANGVSTAVTFQYGLTTAYGLTIPGVPATVTGNSVTPVNGAITGLIPNTLYHYRIVGTSVGGTTNGNDMTFTTGAGSPVVVTNPPTNITTNGAQLNGTVTANSPSATISFEWGLTTAYGNSVAGIPPTATGNSPVASMASLSGLLTNMTYHYRCVAVNSTGTVYGLDQSFLTGCPAPAPAGPITGPASVCQNGTAYVYSVGTIVNAVSYAWTLPTGGTITAGAGTNNITVSYSAAAVSGNVTVAGVGTCGNGTASSLAVTVNPMPVPVIAGPATACANSTGNTYTTAAGLTTYTWNVSAGGTIVSGQGTNSIDVAWNTTGAQTVGLTAVNSFGCSGDAASYPVTVNARPTPTLAGPAAMCANTANNVYTTQAGMSGYVWTVSAGGTITAGGTSTSNSVTITWNTGGAQTVSVNYMNAGGCMAASPVVYNVTVNALPVPTIGSSNDPCVGSTGNMYYTESGMTGYAWTISAGGSIVSGQGTSAINVTWNSVGAQTVGVTYTSATGCNPLAPTIYNLFVNPLPGAAGAITGTSSVCAGANGVAYSCGAIFNATSYTWTLPAGATIATGAGTTNITVNFGAAAVSGNITVAGNNSCGNGTASPAFPVTVGALPAAAGAITGPASVCAGATGVAYSVPVITGATTYTWTVPAGAVITSGATTRNIVVSFGTTPGSGIITVVGTNTCGNGTVSPNFNVTVNAIPAAPVVTAVGPVLTSSAATGNQWYYEGTLVPGATGQSYTVTNNTGYYYCVVTVNGCSSPMSNQVWVEITGMVELQHAGISVYPVPNDGLFTIAITSPVKATYSVQIFNQIGSKIFELTDLSVNGLLEKQIDLRPVASGIYTVVFISNDQKVIRKVLINK